MLIGKDLIDHFLTVGPFLKEIFGKDVVVWVSDKEKVLGYFPGDNFKVDLDSEYLSEDDPMRLAMQQRKTIRTNISEEMFGIPFKEVDNPIYDHYRNVIGCVTVGISLDEETKVAGLAHNLDEAIELIAMSIQRILASAEDIRNRENELRDNIIHINEITNKINKVLSFTKKITSQTNLLSVNASIEASMAGIYGAGFNIIADEIRNLSIETTNTAKNIEELIIEIERVNKKTSECSDLSCAATDDQVRDTQELSNKIDSLKKISSELIIISKEL